MQADSQDRVRAWRTNPPHLGSFLLHELAVVGGLLAFLAASFFASGWILSRRGLEHRSPIEGLTLSQLAAMAVVLLAVAIDPPESVTFNGLVAVAFAGVAAFALATWAGLAGVAALGPSLSVPLQNGARPIVSVLAGVVLLSESFGVIQAIGVASIIVGGWMIVRSAPDEPTADVAASTAQSTTHVGLTSRRTAMLLPILAGVGYAASDLLQHEGVEELGNNAAFATLIALACGTIVWNVGVLTVGRRTPRQLLTGAGVGWMLGTGTLFGLGALTLTLALSEGDVSIVGPIASTQPLVVLALSALFLADTEVITRRKLAGATAVVLGAVLLSTG